jgi:endonuclease-3
MDPKQKIGKIIKILEKEYPSFFETSDPFEVLITTVLSQRTRDENTEIASKNLFKKYKTPEQLAKIPLHELEKIIKPVGFYRQKAKRIKEISKILIEKYNGNVPNRIEQLLSLPGVGRKTANCVLVYGFKIPAIPVDVHVHVISNRLGLVKTKRPEQTETELMKITPLKYWLKLNELLVSHGKKICRAKPKCDVCKLKRYCEYYKLSKR